MAHTPPVAALPTPEMTSLPSPVVTMTEVLKVTVLKMMSSLASLLMLAEMAVPIALRPNM